MDVDVRSIRCFLVLAEERNFGTAARRLGVSQPNLTKIIQTLEDQLHVKLIDRSLRPIRITGVGRVFRNGGRRVVACAEKCERRVRAHATHGSRPLIIGFDQHASAEFAPFLSGQNVRLRPLSLAAGDNPVALLGKGGVQLALTANRSGYGALNSTRVLSEGYVLAFPRILDAAAGPCSIASGLGSHRLIVPAAPMDRSGDDGLRDRLSELHPQVANQLSVRSFADALVLAAFGIGVAIVPASYQRLVVGGLYFRKIRERLPLSEVVMAWRDGCVPEELLDGLQAVGRNKR